MMHFTLTDAQLDKLEFSFKYTWVTVQFKVKGYGYISFGIDSHDSGAHLIGNKVTKDDIAAALKRGAIKLKIWRFVDDEISKREQQATEFLVNMYKPADVEEFYDHYYKD
jgi:hypothetical protein